MSFADVAIAIFNERFRTVGFPMRILEIICWRPVYENSYFENYEPIHDIERLFECDPLYITLYFQYEEREYEYELHYRNKNNNLVLDTFRLNYCQYTPSDDVTLIEDKMRPLMGLLAVTSIPAILSFLYSKEKE